MCASMRCRASLRRKSCSQPPVHTWQIENALHWQLNVAFREDAARNRKDNGPANIAVLRRRALDTARLDQSKGSLTTKLKRAGWDDEFMLKSVDGHLEISSFWTALSLKAE